MFTQEGAPQTHQSLLEISRNTGICQSLVVRPTRSFQSHPPRGKQRSINRTGSPVVQQQNTALSKHFHNDVTAAGACRP